MTLRKPLQGFYVETIRSRELQLRRVATPDPVLPPPARPRWLDALIGNWSGRDHLRADAGASVQSLTLVRLLLERLEHASSSGFAAKVGCLQGTAEHFCDFSHAEPLNFV